VLLRNWRIICADIRLLSLTPVQRRDALGYQQLRRTMDERVDR